MIVCLRRVLGIATLCAVVALLPGTAGPAIAASGKGSPRVDGLERVVLRLINKQRRAHGLHRVKLHRGLNRAADTHSRDMMRRDYFAHDTLGGATWHARIARIAGKRRTGEILAYTGARRGHRARRAMQMWMSSPAHRAVVLSHFRQVGIAARTGSFGGKYSTVFTVDFANRR